MLNEFSSDMDSFQDYHPDTFGYEVVADISTDNTALNKSMLINYLPILTNAREFLNNLATQKLPGDLKKVVSSILVRVETTILRMSTNYQWSMQDNYDLQDLLRVVNKMISVASGLSTIKAVLGVEEPTVSTDTTANVPASPYIDPSALEMTGTGGIGVYPVGFRSKTPEGNAYPKPINATRIGESVVVQDNIYFTEAKITGFNIYTGLYSVRLQDGKELQLDEYQISFKEENPIVEKKEIVEVEKKETDETK